MAERLTGEKALEALEAEMAGLEGLPEYRPRYNIPRVVSALSVLLTGVEGDLEGTLVGAFSEAVAARLGEAVRLTRLSSEVALYTHSEDTRQIETKEDYGALIEEGEALKRAGLQMLLTLEGLGRVSREAARAIRRGRGMLDMAGDIQVLGPLGKKSWDRLEGLQEDQADPSLRVSLERLERMEFVGSEIVRISKLRGKPAVAVDWRQKVIASTALMEREWEYVRKVAGLGYWLADKPEAADALVSLHALRLA